MQGRRSAPVRRWGVKHSIWAKRRVDLAATFHRTRTMFAVTDGDDIKQTMNAPA
jgi:hypothetical protein